jgi:hypothetical protein
MAHLVVDKVVAAEQAVIEQRQALAFLLDQRLRLQSVVAERHKQAQRRMVIMAVIQSLAVSHLQAAATAAVQEQAVMAVQEADLAVVAVVRELAFQVKALTVETVEAPLVGRVAAGLVLLELTASLQ